MARRRRRGDGASPSGIGDVLGAARRAMGVSLQSAAAETHLRESYLAALERDDIGHLDLDPAYVRGTLRTYADYLGLDSDTLVARLRAITPPPEVRAPATVSVVERRQTTRDALWLAVGAAGLALIAVIGFTLGETLALYTTRPASVGASGGSGASAREPTAPSERATALPGRRHPRPFGTERSPVTKPSGAPVAATEAPGRPLELELEFIRSTWVRVEADGTTVLEGRGARRSVEEFAADKRITVRVAKPAALRPTFNGVRYAMLAPKRDGPLKFTCDADDGCEVVE